MIPIAILSIVTTFSSIYFGNGTYARVMTWESKNCSWK
jgi:hypothetical protein